MDEDDERRYEKEQQYEEEQRREENQRYEEEQRREEERVEEENREENRKKRIEERYREDEEYDEEKKRDEEKEVDDEEKASDEEKTEAERFRNSVLKKEYEGMDFFDFEPGIGNTRIGRNRKPKTSGQTEATDAAILGAIGIIFLFTTSQWVSMIVSAIGFVMLYLSWRKDYKKKWFYLGALASIIGMLGGAVFTIIKLFNQ